jgi:hypothetical protein
MWYAKKTGTSCLNAQEGVHDEHSGTLGPQTWKPHVPQNAGYSREYPKTNITYNVICWNKIETIKRKNITVILAATNSYIFCVITHAVCSKSIDVSEE